MALSVRSARAIQPALSYFGMQLEGAAHGVHSASNPDGYILLAVAENRLTFCNLREKLAAVRTRGLDDTTGAYSNMCGRQSFRTAFADMLTRTVLHRSGDCKHLSVDPAHLVVGSGCGGLINNLAFLLADAAANDTVLLPTPTYGALYNDFGALAGISVTDVPLHESDGYRITADKLDKAAASAEAAGKKPALLFLINPSNPLGIIHSEEEVRTAIRWCRGRGMHCVVDEIYANSCYGEPTAAASAGSAGAGASGKEGRFVSAMVVAAQEAGVADGSGSSSSSSAGGWLGNDVHLLYGLSKDWAASGFRLGVLLTHNQQLLTAMSNVNYFTTVSNDTQDSMAAALADVEWADKFLADNRATLRASHAALTRILTAAAIPCVRATAGMFVWLDLRAYLPPADDPSKPADADADAAGWWREQSLTRSLFTECKLLFTPGQACHAAEPGFYRCCFAWMPIESVEAGFQRLAAFVAKRRAASA